MAEAHVIGQELVSGNVAQAQINVEQMKETVTGIQIAQEISDVGATIVDLILIHWQIAVMTQAQVGDKKSCETCNKPLCKQGFFSQTSTERSGKNKKIRIFPAGPEVHPEDMF